MPSSSRRWAGLLACALWAAMALDARTGDRREAGGSTAVRVRLAIASPLECRNVPLDPLIDFGGLIKESGLQGVADPDSVEVVNLATGQPVPCALSRDPLARERLRVAWVMADPAEREYEMRFRVVSRPPPPQARPYTPLIGNGDLLRYNALAPRPITLFFAAGLLDVTGDQRADLVGCWNYAYRPGEPWDGIIAYPRIGDARRWHFGDLARMAYAEPRGSSLQPFQHTYMAAEFADFDGDRLVDLVWTRRGSKAAQFFLNTGKRDGGGLPIFAPSISVPATGWEACRAVDLNGDKALDLVVDGEYIRNDNPQGWPFRAASPVGLDAGRGACFFDVDLDGRLDAVCLAGQPAAEPARYRLAWRRNLGGGVPRFGAEKALPGIELEGVTLVATARDGDRSGLLVQHDAYQSVSFFEYADAARGGPRFVLRGRAESLSAVMSLSDQAWPCACDWDDDGDLDLLVGGGYGWPRIVINEGTRQRPAFAEPQLIEAEAEPVDPGESCPAGGAGSRDRRSEVPSPPSALSRRPIRLLRNQILGEPGSWHNMGYTYPDFVDWNGDGLRDLMLPNETNRIFWYKNIGARGEPKFGRRRQIVCDGHEDSPSLRGQSARRASDPNSNNGVYPLEPEQPFMWRTGAAFADWDGDGLTDFITLDGFRRQAALFVQYRAADGRLRLRRGPPLALSDGRPIDDRIVSRRAHWTESFRAVDWDGDGRTDLIYSLAGCHSGSQDGGSIYVLRNCGTRAKPVFELPRTMCCFGEPIRITNHGPHPWAGDFDGDGRPDLLCCVEWSLYPFYRHAALAMPHRPTLSMGKAERAP